MRYSIKEFNEKSFIKLKESHPKLVENNPEFFDETLMDSFGFQTFEVTGEIERPSELLVRRYIEIGDHLRATIPVTHDIDEDSRIDGEVKVLKQKVSALLPKDVQALTEYDEIVSKVNNDND